MAAVADSAAAGPSLDDLLAEHAGAIEKLRADVGVALPPEWDELWLLRYLLSYPGSQNAAKRVESIKECLAWRAANAEMLADAAAGRPPPHAEAISPYMIADLHQPSSKHGEPLFIVRAGLSNAVAVMSAVTPAQLLAWLMHGKETAFLQCDAESRRRRRIVKMIVVIDMAHTQLAMMDRSYFAVMSDSGKISEYVYPQLMTRSVNIHPPAFFYALFSVMKVFLTKKALEKHSVCPGRSTAHPTAASCPFASRRFDLAGLPSFLGGTCQCSARGGCIRCVPNAETRPVPAGGAGGEVTVPARSHHDMLLVARAAGARLVWAFTIADKGLEVSAWLTPDAAAATDGASGGFAAAAAAAIVVPLLKAHKHSAAEGRVEGELVVPAAGTVTMRFCNAHSVITSKRVTIHVRMEPPPPPAPAPPAPATLLAPLLLPASPNAASAAPPPAAVDPPLTLATPTQPLAAPTTSGDGVVFAV